MHRLPCWAICRRVYQLQRPGRDDRLRVHDRSRSRQPDGDPYGYPSGCTDCPLASNGFSVDPQGCRDACDADALGFECVVFMAYGPGSDHCYLFAEGVATGWNDQAHTSANGGWTTYRKCSGGGDVDMRSFNITTDVMTECPPTGTLVRIILGTRYDGDPTTSDPGGVDGHLTSCGGGESYHIEVEWANGESNSYDFTALYAPSRLSTYMAAPSASSAWPARPTATPTRPQRARSARLALPQHQPGQLPASPVQPAHMVAMLHPIASTALPACMASTALAASMHPFASTA